MLRTRPDGEPSATSIVPPMRAAVTLAAALVAVTVAGCGNSGKQGLSHDQLVKETDAICKRLDKRLAKVEEPENAAGYLEFLEGTHDAVIQSRNDLRALDPSAADAPAYRRLTTTYDQLERTLGELETAAKQEQPYTIERLSSRVDRLVTSSEKIARELGATGCAR